MILYNYEDIRVVHLEITENCQARCPMCDRNMKGGDVNPNLKLHELKLADIQRIMPPEFIKQLDRIYLCGNFGDPIVATDTLEVFKYFREQGRKELVLGMNTNAGAQKPEWWRELAQVMGNKRFSEPVKGSRFTKTWSYVKFSFDGLGDTNHLYRQGVVWDIAWKNAKAFIEAGGRAYWDYLIFAHNEHQVEEAEALAKETGFEKFIPKKTGRFFSTSLKKKNGTKKLDVKQKVKYQATNRKGEETQLLQKPKEVKYQNKETKQITKLEEKHGSLEKYFDNVKIKCKVQEEMAIFISAEGLILPCCWVAGSMYKWWQKPGENQIYELIQESGGKDVFDAKTHGIKSVLNNDYFTNKLVDSWSKPMNTHLGKPMVCAQKCGEEFDAFKAQFE